MPTRILIVEDHVDSLEVLTFQLTAMGYEVIEATTGEEGIEKAQVYHPEIILMDLGLPGINGIEATQRLRNNPETAHIPVIAHTAWPEETFRSEGEKAGISDVLTKPTSPHRFKTTIEKCLKLRTN
ncbi:response regulator [bacterium]|nr:MAG: response regulator [bacterium]